MRFISIFLLAFGTFPGEAFLQPSFLSTSHESSTRINSGVERRIPKGRYDDTRARPVDIKINKKHYRDTEVSQPRPRGRIDDTRAPIKTQPINYQPVTPDTPFNFNNDNTDSTRGPRDSSQHDSFQQINKPAADKAWWNEPHPRRRAQSNGDFGGSDRPWYES